MGVFEIRRLATCMFIRRRNNIASLEEDDLRAASMIFYENINAFECDYELFLGDELLWFSLMPMMQAHDVLFVLIYLSQEPF